MIKQSVTANGLVADLFTGDTAQPRKAILMLGGSEGGKLWSRIKRPVTFLVQKGYAVLSLAYFKAPGLPDCLQEIPLEYFEKAFNWLSAQNGIVPDQVAVLGGSKGAEAALVLGSRYPQVKAVIAFSPSCVVWQGIPAKRFEIGMDIKSSWSYQGESLPFLPYPASIKKMDLRLLRLRKMHIEALQNTARLQEAAIQVERIRGALLLISGQRDRLWPATRMSYRIMERLQAAEFQYPSQHLAYNTGHQGIIMNKDIWRQVFSFLADHYR